MALRIRWLSGISDAPREAWDSLAAPLATPVLEWEWLRQLEVSGSIRPEAGWLPVHLTVWRGSDLVAGAPLYVKGHSGGEFVWDHLWVEVAGHLGLPYYPKLVGMSPATPITGYRFLVAPGEDVDRLTDVMADAIGDLCRRAGLSGVSFPYADPAWGKRLEARGFLAWRHQSFLWRNRGLRTFEDYLMAFDHHQRRNIRRERRTVACAGVEVRPLTGAAIRRSDLRAMRRFYEKTNARFGPWAAKYLEKAFFEGLFEGYRDRLLLFSARREGAEAPVGMSLLLVKGDRMYGRYWGSAERIDSLHFELCYYAPIEWAIAQGIREFDPGIGGEHKVRRGFRAVENHSLHRFTDPRLQEVMAVNLDRLNEATRERIDELNRGLPLAEGRQES